MFKPWSLKKMTVHSMKMSLLPCMICRIQWYAFCQHSFMDLPDIFHGMEFISNKGPYNFHTMDFQILWCGRTF